MYEVSEVHITLCDHLNPGFGYQIRIVDSHGVELLFTSKNPASGANLLTYADAIKVAEYYT